MYVVFHHHYLIILVQLACVLHVYLCCAIIHVCVQPAVSAGQYDTSSQKFVTPGLKHSKQGNCL